VRKITKKEVSNKVYDWWNDYIADINADAEYLSFEDTEYAEMSNAAFEKYQEIDSKYVDIQNDEEADQNMKSYISKVKTYIPRFALFLSFCDHIDPDIQQPHFNVELHHVERAEKIADYFLKTAKHVFVDSEERNEYSEVLQGLKYKTTAEKAIALKDRGLSNKKIAQILDKSPGRISQIIKKG
jgi:cell fate (sporulation/competence/biofilm development) regulator YlbF (YheA/YmcA/DUF963 family)